MHSLKTPLIPSLPTPPPPYIIPPFPNFLDIGADSQKYNSTAAAPTCASVLFDSSSASCHGYVSMLSSVMFGFV